MIARPAGIVAVVIAAALLAGCAPATTPTGHAELRLLGVWTGVADPDGNGVLQMAVADAADDGSAFEGDLTYAMGGTRSTETVTASLTPHGHLVAGVGAHASIEVHITDPETLDYCFVVYGAESSYTCGRLVRAP